MLSRHLHRLTVLVLGAALLAAPTTALAADPPLGGPVTLPDGTVLPPLPAEQLAESVHAQQLAEHSELPASVGTMALAAPTTGVVQADPLVIGNTAANGPGGPLPNGLTHEVLGFLPYWKLDTTTRASLRLDLLSTVAYFSIGASSDGSLARGTPSVPTIGWAGWTSPALTELMNAAHARGVRVVPTITMMAFNGDYSAMSTLLNSEANRARLVSEVVGIVRDRRADGVNIDFEPVPSTLRAQFTALVREMKGGLVAAGVGSYVTVSTMAGAAAWATGYDVVGLTSSGAADALMVMAYDFHWPGSSRAGAVAPMDSPYIYDARDSMRDHLARVPASKIIWGVPYYGRAWNTTSHDLNSTVRSPAQVVDFSYYWTDAGAPAGGRVLAERFGRRWDPAGQVPWFSFTNGDGGPRQGYFDDPVSIRAKYDMVLRNNVSGIGIWSLGMDTGVPDLWNVIAERFHRVQRLAGADRYATAARVSAASYGPGVPVAYVATGQNFPDALAAGPLAARGGGPVLLTTASVVPRPTADELARLRPSRIVVLGGTGVVSDAVLAALRPYATSGSVQRIAGPDRFATAAAASAAVFEAGAPVAYVATGTGFPDALAGGVAAAKDGGPVLLATRDELPAATANELARLRPSRIVVLGGTGVISQGVAAALAGYATTGQVGRFAGANRYETAVAISRATVPDNAQRTVYIATGVAFPDGLAGTPVAAAGSGPLLIVPSGGLTDVIVQELRRLNPPRVVILGGEGAVSSTVAAQIAGVWDR